MVVVLVKIMDVLVVVPAVIRMRRKRNRIVIIFNNEIKEKLVLDSAGFSL